MSLSTANTVATICVAITLILGIVNTVIHHYQKTPIWLYITSITIEIILAINLIGITLYMLINWPHYAYNSIYFVFAVLIALFSWSNNKHDIKSYNPKKDNTEKK